MGIPEPKLLKGSYLLSQPCFDAGETRVPLLEVQKLHGTWQYYQVVQPSLRPEMGAISALLRQTDPAASLFARQAARRTVRKPSKSSGTRWKWAGCLQHGQRPGKPLL